MIFLNQLIINNSFAQMPTASFNTLPASSGGVITICKGQTIIYSNTSTNTIPGSTYSWSFGSGASPASASGVGPHVVTYNNATTTAATLTVSNGVGLVNTASVNVQVNAPPVSNITLINSSSSFSTSTSGGVTLFRNCSSASTSTFSFNVSSYPAGTTQTFNWGDGSPNSNETDITSNQIAHTYSLGQYTLTHTVLLPTGCQTVRTYSVFNGDAPLLSISGSGQTTCLPFPYSLDILSNHIPGTNYTVSFTDGSPSILFTTINDTTISHQFNSSSCGESYLVGPVPIQNAFEATIVAQNTCGTTFATIGPIIISTGTNAEFSYQPASPVCQNEPVTFFNTSNGGENVSQSGCSNDYSYYWRLEESSGWTVTNGSMGSNNGFIGASYDYTSWDTPVVDSVEVTFNTPGTYHMWIYTANACGIDSIMHSVVINPTAIVNMNPINPVICSGELSDSIFMVSTIPGYLITWEIEDTVNVVGITTMNGSGYSADTINPILLNNPTNQLGYVVISATVGCTNVPPTLDTIFVNPQGNLIVTPLNDYLCSNESTNISISSNLQGATYSWTVSSPSTITGATGGAGNNIAQQLFNSGNTIDTAFYTIYIGNVLCPGDSVVVPIAVQPGIILNQINDTIVCSGALINPVNIVSSPVGATLTWQNTNTNIGLGASGSGQVPTWTTPANTTGSSIFGTVTINAVLDPSCPGTQTDFIVTLSPTGNIVVSNLDTLICNGQTPDITVQSSISSATISWTPNSPSSISGASNGSGNIGTISDVLNNNGSTSSVDTVFYTISISNVQCPNPNVIVAVAVQPTITLNQINDTSVCAGANINPVNIVTSPPGATLTWQNTNTNIGLGASGSGQVPTWTAPSNTTGSSISGTVTINAVLDPSCPGTQTDFIVTLNPTGNIVVSNLDTLICNGETPDITIQSNVSSATISWTATSPSSISGASNGSGNPGTISDVLNNNGATSSIDTVFYNISISNVQCPVPNVSVAVAVQPQITINDVPNILVCPGQSINPVDFISIPSGATFSWTNNNTTIGIGTSGNGQIPTWTAPVNNTSNTISGTVTVTASLNGCPSAQDQFTVSINPTPDYTYTLNPPTGISCVSPNVDISGTVVPAGSSIVWVGPGIVSGQGTSSITINAPGTYSITVSDLSTGCSSTENITMQPPTQINITSALTQNITCAGASNGSIIITTDNSTGVTYNWNPNISSTSNANNLIPGSYTVTVSNDDLCEDDTTLIISQPLPIIVAMVDSLGSECGEANGSLSVNASGGLGGFSYSWSNGITGPSISGIDAGNYTVTVTDNSGCSVNQVFDLGCTPLVPIVVPQLITPNNDGKNDLWIIQNVEQYPDMKVWVYNRWGNLVYQSQPYQNNWNGYYTEGGNVNGPLPASTYFYLIDTMKKSQDPIKGYLEIQP